jgi:hypothetical protein
MNELYSHVNYKGYKIFIEQESYDDSDYVLYFGQVYLNGTCIVENVQSLTYPKCLQKCKDDIDTIIEEEGYY